MRAAIPCGFAGCGQTAAVVELIPKGAVYADGRKDILHELDSGFSGRGTFRVRDFLRHANYSVAVADYEAVATVVCGETDDVAAALYRRDKEYAPFFCAECGYSYCGTHWKLNPVFDECGFDYYTGCCPVGHRKFIDH